ncbi:MAG: phospholipase [Chloroflexota bacterium]|jgi:phospholipase C|nr:phospholipase [Chloroflexota bacterium]
MSSVIRRRTLLKAAGAAAGLAAIEPWRAITSFAAAPRAVQPAPFDHVVVLMMENRSWDHMLGWLPGSNGVQAGLSYTDTKGVTYPTYPLVTATSQDYQGCGYADPDHSWEGGAKQLNGGRNDGFLKTAAAGDTFPVGYYGEADVPILGALARNYTTSDNYFCSILAETYPNRFYQHAAQTDRDHNSFTQATIPTIWDRLTGGLTGKYYFSDAPFLALWGPTYAPIIHSFPTFLLDCANGTLPNVAFVDPAFEDEGTGSSRDSHPHGDIRSGEAFIGQVYNAVRSSPNWSKTVLVVNFDEWGGFYDHVVPPRVVDDHVNPAAGPHPDYRQLGFRVPNVVISPFSHPGRIVSSGAPFEHTSILRMIEWRWGLTPLNARDANARNLVDMLDFNLNRTDTPVVANPGLVASIPCGPTSTKASPPQPVGGAGGAGQGSGGGGSGAGSGGLPNTATGDGLGLPAVAATAIATGAVGAANRRRARAVNSADEAVSPA